MMPYLIPGEDVCALDVSVHHTLLMEVCQAMKHLHVVIHSIRRSIEPQREVLQRAGCRGDADRACADQHQGVPVQCGMYTPYTLCVDCHGQRPFMPAMKIYSEQVRLGVHLRYVHRRQ